MISAITQREKLTEIVELPRDVHPGSSACSSTRVQVHAAGPPALFTAFVKAALSQKQKAALMELCGFQVGLDRPLP